MAARKRRGCGCPRCRDRAAVGGPRDCHWASVASASVVTDLLEGLSPAQIEAVTTPGAPLAVVAGPGSGKTRVLTRRVAWRCREGDADPAHALVLTFSRRASSDLWSRLGGLGLQAGMRQGGVAAGTFHAIAWATLSRHYADRGIAAPAILGRPGRLLGRALAEVLGRDPRHEELGAVIAEISWARAQGAGLAAYAAGDGCSGRADPDTVARSWEGYTHAKRSRRVLDLDDLLSSCADLMESDREAAQAVRWRHRHVFVDEYQDLNAAHLRLLRAWVGDGSDLFVVGDPDQAIYGFNGASADLFDKVSQDWPGVSVLSLTDNFRSTPEVVAFVGAVRPGAGPAARETGSRREPGPVPTITAHSDDVAEAAAVAASISARRGPSGSWAGMAVLARTNARIRLVADALDRAGIPWRLRDPRPLADRSIVRTWLDALPASSPAVDLLDILAEGGSEGDLVAGALSEYAAVTPAGTVAGFGAWLTATGVAGEETPGQGVDLATFHRAKGLEWRAVWVVGVEEGLVPLGSVLDGPALAEEQRLLYVALTRAGDELAVSWSARRMTSRGSTTLCAPSRWLAPLAAAATALATEPAVGDQRARWAKLREDLGPAGEAARREALLAWRAARARAARVPPAVILPDRTLATLARSGSTTADDVLRLVSDDGRRLARWTPELVHVLATAAGQ